MGASDRTLRGTAQPFLGHILGYNRNEQSDNSIDAASAFGDLSQLSNQFVIGSGGASDIPQQDNIIRIARPKSGQIIDAHFTMALRTATVIAYDTELFDTNNNFDVTTNKGRYTAPVAGFYWFSAHAGNSAAASTQIQTYLWKNGSSTAVLNGNGVDSTLNGGQTSSIVSGILQLAANDFVEAAFIGGGGSTMNVGQAQLYFHGCLISRT